MYYDLDCTKVMHTQTTERWLPEGKGGGEDEEGNGGQVYGDRRHYTSGGEHTIEYIDVIL